MNEKLPPPKDPVTGKCADEDYCGIPIESISNHSPVIAHAGHNMIISDKPVCQHCGEFIEIIGWKVVGK